MRRVHALSAAAATVSAAALGLFAAGAPGNTSHAGWPRIDGVLLMNKTDGRRPLDARPGHDPFGRRDRRYSCDAIHKRGKCHRRFIRVRGRRGRVMTFRHGHNELLGGHGSDTIHAGPWGDVIWGDYKPSGQPTRQHDRIWGGPGRDHIYASHGKNAIRAGGGNDWIKAHFGFGLVNCGGGNDLLYISRRAQKHYKIRNCERISHKTLGR
jgi:Ca2+-binding RTX toxin-like protein